MIKTIQQITTLLKDRDYNSSLNGDIIAIYPAPGEYDFISSILKKHLECRVSRKTLDSVKKNYIYIFTQQPKG